MRSKKCFALFLTLFLVCVINGQILPPPPSPPGLFIDGGAVFLFISGLIYGVKKMKNKE